VLPVHAVPDVTNMVLCSPLCQFMFKPQPHVYNLFRCGLHIFSQHIIIGVTTSLAFPGMNDWVKFCIKCFKHCSRNLVHIGQILKDSGCNCISMGRNCVIIYWVIIGFTKKQSKRSDEITSNNMSPVVLPLVLQIIIPVLQDYDLQWSHLIHNVCPCNVITPVW
jgi:hypothetical protein